MKLSKLKKIIRESLNFLNEQPGFPDPKLCDENDFDPKGQCAQDHLFNGPLGNIGGVNSWNTWLHNQWNAYSGTAGCYQFGAIQNWTLSAITPTANCPALPGMSQFGQYGGGNQNGCYPLINVKRKFAKAKWALCMQQKCCRDIDDPIDSFRCVDGNCVSCNGPGCPYPTLRDCEKDCGPINDPCEKFNGASQQMQDGCCGKCLNGVYSGTSGDYCDTLTNSCKCCDDDLGREDVRGCLKPAQSGAINIGMPCPGSTGTVTLHNEECCEYDRRVDDPCRDNPGCYWCQAEQGSSCVPVGSNLQYAQNNGFTLYPNAPACNAAEPGCRASGGPQAKIADPGMQRMKDLMEYKKPK